MRFEPTGLAGPVLIRPQRHVDERGHFVRTFDEAEFAAAGLVTRFVQRSLSHNLRLGTLRGLHFQRAPHGETKLVRCSRGAILDVVVDLRPDEPTFLHWRGFELSAENGDALYIPDGFAHGFQTLADDTDVDYAISPAFVPGAGAGLRYDDPAIDVRWPLPISAVSAKDRTWPLLASSRAPAAEAVAT